MNTTVLPQQQQHTNALAANGKVVLAYSGGLDTTYCAIYLDRIRHLEVHALTVNTGGFSEAEIRQIGTRARQLGVASFTCVDVTREYYDSCIRYLIYGNVPKEWCRPSPSPNM